MNTATQQPKRTLEDFKKLGATLHQKLVLARVAPALLKLQPQPDKENPVLNAMRQIGKPRHAFTDPEPDDIRMPPVFKPMKKVKVVVATKEQKEKATTK
jgi:hypothetical protein